jgi:tetratricopeptide (TPR) repeat protein
MATYMAGLGHAYGVSGRKDEARKVLNELKQLARQRYISAYDMALIYLGLGKKDLAFAWLEKAYEERSFELSFIKAEPQVRQPALRPALPRPAASHRPAALDFSAKGNARVLAKFGQT